MEMIHGEAKSFVFRSDNGEFAVMNMRHDGEMIKVSGAIGNVIEGLSVMCRGYWVDSPKYGRQFKAESAKTQEPTDGRGIVTYLASGLIAGVGKVFAQRIYDHFKEDTLSVIKKTPERLREVPGVGPKRAETLSQSVHIQVAMEAISIWLFDHQIGENIAMRIYKKYGNEAVEVLNENPYVLADEMYGVGFKTADRIAHALGFENHDIRRLSAGLLYLMGQAENSGHTMMPFGELMGRGASLLGDYELKPAVDRLAALKEVMFMPSGIYLTSIVQKKNLFYMEKNIAFSLARRNEMTAVIPIDEAALNAAQERAGFKLDPSQHEAAKRILSNSFSILTGRPGTGKTATLKVVLDAFEGNQVLALLASPTGKAARRMSEATGRPASTIHRLLQFNPSDGRFLHNRENPLECDALVIDEASMLDTRLMHSVVEALPTNARLLLVGDTNQLPSVGAGRVLGDLIDSEAASFNALDKIHRQAAGSAIITNAHSIIEGRGKDIIDGVDFRYIDYGPGDKIANGLPVLIKDKLVPSLGIKNPIDDIQVLTAGHRGPLGTITLNPILQKTLNPNPRLSQVYRGVTYSVGDKIIVTRNNYDLGVFNGTLGRIVDICDRYNPTTKKPIEGLVIALETGESMEFMGTDRNDIAPGWVLTVHKTQGSEFPVVVMVLDTSQSIMLERNWLYTGVTRAQKHCILVGPRKALDRAIKTVRADKRYTLLSERISTRV